MASIGKFRTVNDWVKILPDNFEVKVRPYDSMVGFRTTVKNWKKAQSMAHVCKVDIDWDRDTAELTTIVGADDNELMVIDTDKLTEEYDNTVEKEKQIRYDKEKLDSVIENNEWYAKMLIDSKQENCEEEIETCLDIARWLRELRERRKNDGTCK